MGSHIYEKIPDVLPGRQSRSSGVYDEIPELPIAGKERTDLTGSSDSIRPFGKQGSVNMAAEHDRRATKKNIADKVLRRRSFVKEKPSLTPKISLSSVTSGGVVLVGAPVQSVENRFDVDLTLPVNENKGSILKLFRTLKRSAAPSKQRGNNYSDLF